MYMSEKNLIFNIHIKETLGFLSKDKNMLGVK